MASELIIKGAKARNLKNINTSFPHDSLSVISGPSGSGKSTLLYEVINRELAKNFRLILGGVKSSSEDLSLVDSVKGVRYPIACEVKALRGKDQTFSGLVGIEEILVKLYLAKAKRICPNCKSEIRKNTARAIIEALEVATNCYILGPALSLKKTELEALGYTKVFIEGEVLSLEDIEEIPANTFVVIDIWNNLPGKFKTFEVLNAARELNGGVLKIEFLDSKEPSSTFSLDDTCPSCFSALERLSKKSYSLSELSDLKALPESSSANESKLFGLSFLEACSVPVSDLVNWVRNKNEPILKELLARLELMDKLGLAHLSLNRTATSLSSGEYIRARLTPFLVHQKRGAIFLLDEPLSRLHPINRDALWRVLQELIESKNSVLLIEHDKGARKGANYQLELGPSSGEKGGEVVEAKKKEGSKKYSPVQPEVNFRKKDSLKYAKISGIKHRNLNNVDVRFPLGAVVSICGVSGSGKSSLVEVIRQAFSEVRVHETYKKIEIAEEVAIKVFFMNDVSQIKSPKSVVATSLGIWDAIRKLYSELPKAKARGLSAGDFSFNKKTFSCEECGGAGQIKFDKYNYENCSKCGGRRYSEEVEAFKWKNHSLPDLLELNLSQASEVFSWLKPLTKMLESAEALQLSYLKLGQSLGSLSSGEFQRLQLLKNLAKNSKDKKIYIFDEPSRGLGEGEVLALREVFQKISGPKVSIFYIEHNPEMIFSSDYVIELGPEAGDKGGQVTFQGSPEELFKTKRWQSIFAP